MLVTLRGWYDQQRSWLNAGEFLMFFIFVYGGQACSKVQYQYTLHTTSKIPFLCSVALYSCQSSSGCLPCLEIASGLTGVLQTLFNLSLMSVASSLVAVTPWCPSPRIKLSPRQISHLPVTTRNSSTSATA